LAFDWKRFLRAHRIQFVEGGPNWARGNVNVRCPFCGTADHSEHMGISLHGKGYACRRNMQHAGKSRARLIQALLGCSQAEARALAGYEVEAVPAVADTALGSHVRSLLGGHTAPVKQSLELLPEFRPLALDDPWAGPFLDYLEDRGYRDTQIEWLIKAYDLHYARSGSFAYRIIFPIKDRWGRLMSWTGRSIRQDVKMRYKTLRLSGDPPLALAPGNDLLLGLPLLWSCETPRVLVLVEGPFDATRVTVFGRSWGVYATSLFGLNVSTAQASLIQELAGRFQRVVLLIDPEAVLQRMRLLRALSACDPGVAYTPDGFEDPGALSGAAATALAQRLLD
jgi:hypothetical protein